VLLGVATVGSGGDEGDGAYGPPARQQRHAHQRAGLEPQQDVEVLAAVVDELDRLEPVTEVRATGGVFRSRVWREVLAGALGRPLSVTGDAEGTALGAAALALLATGRAQTLHEGFSRLSPATTTGGGADVRTSADDRDAYVRLRAAVPALLESYADVARLFADDPARARVPAGAAMR
jgi:gluconokinase